MIQVVCVIVAHDTERLTRAHVEDFVLGVLEETDLGVVRLSESVDFERDMDELLLSALLERDELFGETAA